MHTFWQTSPINHGYHLVREPRRHKFVALKMAKDSLDLIHPAISGYDLFHLVAIFSARSLTKHRPKTPSTETTRGVKEAWRTSAASQYFLFFSSSAVDRIAATSLCEYDGVSVSTTRQCYRLRLPYPSDTKISYQ